jgi:hypothetical protein
MGYMIDDEELDRQLRDSVTYLDDAGFTAGVLQRLPVAAAPGRLRGAILIVATIIASVLAYFLSGGGRFVNDLILQLSQLKMEWLLALTLGAGIIVGALGLVAAVFKAREPALITR